MAIENSDWIWTPDESTSFDYTANLATMKSSIENRVTPYIYDTGWVDCALLSGTTQQGQSLPQVRRIGPQILMRWGISGNNVPANAGKDVFRIPIGFRPTEWKYFPVITATAASTATTVVKSDGIVTLKTPATTSSYYMWDTAHWTID